MSQGTTKGVPIDVDGTLSADSDVLVASQKATKTYVDLGLSNKVNRSGDTMSGSLILVGNPTAAYEAATKDYVDTLINGIDWKAAADAATVSSLPTYTVTGSGQILTGSVNGSIPSGTTDGVTLTANQRLLVKNETSTLTPNNGIYVVTQVGNGSTPFTLTRSNDANTPSLLSEATLSIKAGTTLSNTQWHCNPAIIPPVIGTTYITFAQIGSGNYTFTSPLLDTGGVISIYTATSAVTGALSSTDWTTFNNKQNTLSGTGVVKSTAGTISYINGTSAQYIAGDGSLISFPTIPTVGTWGALNYPTWTTGTPFVKMTAAGTFALDTTTYLSSISSSDVTTALGYTPYNSTNPNNYISSITSSNVTTALGYTPVTNARTLSINGTSYDLSANRTWTVGTVTSVALSGSSAFAITGSPITTSGTITISGTGTTSQYIDGTGSLQSFPSITKFSSNRPVATTASVTTYGAWYRQFWPSTAAVTNTALNLNQVWLTPVQLPAGLVINEIAFAITTAGSAGALVSVGIYSSTVVNGEIRADALLSNFGSVSTSTTGRKVITSLNYTVPSGTTDFFWIALVGTVATPGNISFISNPVKQYMGFTSAGGAQYGSWTLTGQTSLPATISLATWLTGSDNSSMLQIGYK